MGDDGAATATVARSNPSGDADDRPLSLTVTPYGDEGVIRVRLDDDARPRYEVPDVLVPGLDAERRAFDEVTHDAGTGTTTFTLHAKRRDASLVSSRRVITLSVTHDPMRVALAVNGRETAVFNDEGRFDFERERTNGRGRTRRGRKPSTATRTRARAARWPWCWTSPSPGTTCTCTGSPSAPRASVSGTRTGKPRARMVATTTKKAVLLLATRRTTTTRNARTRVRNTRSRTVCTTWTCSSTSTTRRSDCTARFRSCTRDQGSRDGRLLLRRTRRHSKASSTRACTCTTPRRRTWTSGGTASRRAVPAVPAVPVPRTLWMSESGAADFSSCPARARRRRRRSTRR